MIDDGYDAAAAVPRRQMMLRIRPRPGGSALRVLPGLAGGLWLLVNIGSVVVPIIDDVTIGARGGLPASVAAVQGDPDCQRWLPVVVCTLQVAYATSAGPHHEELQLVLLTAPVAPPDTPFTLRYDPDDPRRFSTSWGRARLPERAAIEVVLLVGFAYLLRLGLGGLFARIRQRWRLTAIGRAPQAVIAEIMDITPSGTWTGYRLRWIEASGARRACRTRLPRGDAPCWADPLRTRVLALATTRSRAQVLDDALRIPDFTDAERAGLRRAIDMELARAG